MNNNTSIITYETAYLALDDEKLSAKEMYIVAKQELASAQ